MADYSDIRKGLKAVLDGQIEGLRVYEYEPDSGLEYPCLVIEQVAQHAYMPILAAGGFKADLTAVLYVHHMSSVEGWKAIEEYRWPTGNKSIFAAVNSDNTLKKSVNHAWVKATGEVDRAKNDQSRFWEFTCEFTIELVHAVS